MSDEQRREADELRRDGVLKPEAEMGLKPGSGGAGASLASGEAAAGYYGETLMIEQQSLGGEVWRRFRRDKFAMAGLAAIIIIVLLAVFAPWIAPHNPLTQFNDGITMQGMPVGSSAKFPLGTDTLGRDMLSRLLYGARISLFIGIVANGLALLLGVVFGLTAGYFKGGTETLIMRMTDVMMAFPILLLAIALSTTVFSKGGIWLLVVVITIVYWTPMTRVIHGEVLSIREKEFVDAARLTGATNRRILFRHILPHLVAPIIVYTSLGIATTIVFEATLSYIGVGVQPPTPSWGQMIAMGQDYYYTAPQLVIYPGLAIVITVLAFNLVGDGLRDAFDPQQRRR